MPSREGGFQSPSPLLARAGSSWQPRMEGRHHRSSQGSPGDRGHPTPRCSLVVPRSWALPGLCWARGQNLSVSWGLLVLALYLSHGPSALGAAVLCVASHPLHSLCPSPGDRPSNHRGPWEMCLESTPHSQVLLLPFESSGSVASPHPPCFGNRLGFSSVEPPDHRQRV